MQLLLSVRVDPLVIMVSIEGFKLGVILLDPFIERVICNGVMVSYEIEGHCV